MCGVDCRFILHSCLTAALKLEDQIFDFLDDVEILSAYGGAWRNFCFVIVRESGCSSFSIGIRVGCFTNTKHLFRDTPQNGGSSFVIHRLLLSLVYKNDGIIIKQKTKQNKDTGYTKPKRSLSDTKSGIFVSMSIWW